VLPLSIGDGELCETALTTVSVPEMFRYWLQGGRITVGFLGGAQIDRYANLNTTVVGATTIPRCAYPAAAGHPRSPRAARQVFITMSMSPRTFVQTAAVHHLFGPRHRPGQPRGARAAHAGSDQGVITDLCIFEPDPDTRELQVTSLHPGVTEEATRAACGWPLRFSDRLTTTAAPSDRELAVLRDLQARSTAAHRENS
jgi:glutaconate CoA-transferase subunit B